MELVKDIFLMSRNPIEAKGTGNLFNDLCSYHPFD